MTTSVGALFMKPELILTVAVCAFALWVLFSHAWHCVPRRRRTRRHKVRCERRFSRLQVRVRRSSHLQILPSSHLR
jgi:hypothetical protein